MKMSLAITSRPRMTISRKIYALIFLGFLGLLGITWLDSRELASGLRQQKLVELQHLTETALSVVKDEYAAAQKGEIADAEAQKRAQARVAKLRYGKDDFFVIEDMEAHIPDASDDASTRRQGHVPRQGMPTESPSSRNDGASEADRQRIF